MKTLEKQSTEKRELFMSFSDKMSSGEIISTVDSSASFPVGITFETPTAYAKDVGLLLSGGDVNKTYKITVTVTTSTGQILENEGLLEIVDT